MNIIIYCYPFIIIHVFSEKEGVNIDANRIPSTHVDNTSASSHDVLMHNVTGKQHNTHQQFNHAQHFISPFHKYFNVNYYIGVSNVIIRLPQR